MIRIASWKSEDTHFNVVYTLLVYNRKSNSGQKLKQADTVSTISKLRKAAVLPFTPVLLLRNICNIINNNIT